MALPNWLDQVPNLDFGKEKELLQQLLAWLEHEGWQRVNVNDLDQQDRQQTDLAFSRGGEHLRLAVMPKQRSSTASVRVQALPGYESALLVQRENSPDWGIEVGGLLIEDRLTEERFHWLLQRFFPKPDGAAPR